VKPTIEAFKNRPKRHGHFRSPLTGVDLIVHMCKVRTRNCAANSWLLQPRSVAATIGAMRPTPAELEVARALIARVKAADPSIKLVDELLVCAAKSGRRAWRRPTLRSGDGQEHLEAEAGVRLGRSA